MNTICAWRGCPEICPPGDIPDGWICLVTFHETADPRYLDFLTDQTQRDALLCPMHAWSLERLLKQRPEQEN